jgi:hypothetical protein
MTLDEILKGLFPSGHDVKTSAADIIAGTGKRKNGKDIAVIGVANGARDRWGSASGGGGAARGGGGR